MKSIAEKLSLIMAEVETIEQNGHNTYSNFHYSTVDDVLKAVRPLFGKHGLAVIPSLQSIQVIQPTIEGESPTLRGFLTYTIIDSESGNQLKADWIAEANLKMGKDKSSNIIVSTANKFFLRSLLMLDTGDPDGDHNINEQGKRKGQEPQPITVPTYLKIVKLGNEAMGEKWEESKETMANWASQDKIDTLEQLSEPEALFIVKELEKRLAN